MSADSKALFKGVLDGHNFANQFGVDYAALSPETRTLIAGGDWHYSYLTMEARDTVLLNILKKITSGSLTIAGEKNRWDVGWGEVLKTFSQTGNPEDLVPKYIRSRQPVRLHQEFVLPNDDEFEFRWYEVLRRWLFDYWLSPYDVICEFGCGTGHNLAAFASWDSTKKYTGLDWSQPAVATVNSIGKILNVDIRGLQFDFFNPNISLDLAGSAVLTIGALEQTSRRYTTFIEWLIARRPEICVHVEPIPEWYNDKCLVDWTAIEFLKVRKYWTGFPQLMERLEAEEKVTILHRKRTGVGSLFMEGYMLFIWRPL